MCVLGPTGQIVDIDPYDGKLVPRITDATTYVANKVPGPRVVWWQVENDPNRRCSK